MARRLFVAKEAFSGTDADGVPFVVNAGQTIREGHPLLKGREVYVEELSKADWEYDDAPVEQATAAPGEKRTTKRR